MSPEIETATLESQRPLRWPSNPGCYCCLRLGSLSHGEMHSFKENEQTEQLVADPASPSNRHCRSDSENPYRHIMHGSPLMLALPPSAWHLTSPHRINSSWQLNSTGRVPGPMQMKVDLIRSQERWIKKPEFLAFLAQGPGFNSQSPRYREKSGVLFCWGKNSLLIILSFHHLFILLIKELNQKYGLKLPQNHKWSLRPEVK